MSKPMPPAFERSRTMKQEIKDLYGLWLKKTEGNAELHDELSAIEGKEDEISDRFYRALEFGTGGLRGVLGAGTNRMNVSPSTRRPRVWRIISTQSMIPHPSR